MRAGDQDGPDGADVPTVTGMEETMDANLGADAEILRPTLERMSRVGLVFDRSCLSPQQRRVIITDDEDSPVIVLGAR
jgi:hypothetical protein